jgi:hypothetical protein
VSGGLLGGGGLQVVGGAADGIELGEQRLGLVAEGPFDQRGLLQVVAAEDGLEPLGFGLQGALAAGLFE